MAEDTLSVAVVQCDAIPGETEANLKAVEPYLLQAAESGAELVLLPELISFGYDLSLAGVKPWESELCTRFFGDQSRKLGLCIAAGYPEMSGSTVFDSLGVFEKGHKTALYRKMHLFPLSGEDRIFSQGSEPVVAEIRGWRIGLSICFDLRFPELYRFYRRAGCGLILVSAAFPSVRKDHWNILVRSRAVENQLFIAAANRSGKDGDSEFCGSSTILGPRGEVLSFLDLPEQGLINHILDRSSLAESRASLPCREHPFFSP